MRDLIVGLTLIVASVVLITAQLAHAVHHDCSHNPPLQSNVFGKAVPIEAICSIIR